MASKWNTMDCFQDRNKKNTSQKSKQPEISGKFTGIVKYALTKSYGLLLNDTNNL